MLARITERETESSIGPIT